MFRQGYARRALLLLIVLAVAFLWTADQGIRAAADDRAENGATPAKAADKAGADTTVKDPPPATPAKATTTATTTAEPAPATAAAAPQKAPTNRVTERRKQNQAVQAAAQAARDRGLKPGVAGLAGTALGAPVAAGAMPTYADPGGIPHYFGPYGNWAFSPLPIGTITGFVLTDGGKKYSATPVVTINDAYDATKSDTATAVVQGGQIKSLTLNAGGSGGAGYTAPVVTITDPTGTGAAATATLAVSGGLPKFVDGLPGLGPGGANNLGQYIPVGVPENCTYSGQAADCYSIALVEYTEKLHTKLPATRLRGYVQLSTTGTITLSNPDGTPIPMPSGMKAVDHPHYLGPLIIATGRVAGLDAAGVPAGAPKPVRITFYNLLPTGAGGDLFLPVDETVPGSGLGPAGPGTAGSKYTQNRATIHLHGNNTVWISDGNTHQWITPAGEGTPYPAGVSARNVPDMPGCASDPAHPELPGTSGCMTFFYTNAQSARLQFYHDHAHGITRLNVYAGEAAGYLLTDAVEKDMINGTNQSGIYGIDAAGAPIPGTYAKVLPGLGIPLIIQDKTFVDADSVFAQDPTWNWGTGPRDATTGNITGAVTGDLWYPHVYMPVTNPYDVTGTNAFGRWFYGPWFNPPTPVCVNGLPLGCIEVGTVPNEYFGIPEWAQWEPPVRPGVPNPSIPGESFMDTPLVNGTAYPYVEVPAGPVRFRVLNANNDRALNLQIYQAFDSAGFHFGTGAADPSTATQACAGLLSCTEVKMVPVSVNPANQFADTASGIPDPTTAGPPWIQIGTEGGFMPAPVVVPQQPIGFNMNTGQFNFSIVNQHSLYLLPAERADVIVDFTGKSGTYILYNDAPAPVPAGAAVYDYYSGDGDQTGAGGAPNTLPGYGPNTRTIMQIRVTGTPNLNPVDLTALDGVFAKAAGKRGVFEISQDPIIIPQAAYNTAYNQTFPSDASQYILNVGAFDKSFKPLVYDSATTSWSLQATAVTMPLELKAMHDEMGGVYDTMFGRMSGMLGITHPNFPGMIPFPFSAPPTDLVKGSLEATPIGTLADGTQLWRIFHNGVDTHPIHTHLFTAQLISRVGQDGQVAEGTLPVDPTDLGWKDTFKINPLEIAFFALRPTVPTVSQVPFEVPISIRLIDPTLPEGATLPPPGPTGWFDPATNAIPEILNHYVNFGWEYVWHCHILSHEEMDFMHTLVFTAPPRAPSALAASVTVTPSVILTWADNSTVETQFTVQRASDVNFTTGLRTFIVPSPTPNTTGARTYTDTAVSSNTKYWYKVFANGAIVGDTSMANFPTMSTDSVSNVVEVLVGTTAPGVPLAPTTLTATVQTGPRVSLTWRDNATNETGFGIGRCTVVAPATNCSNFVQIAIAPPRNNTGNTTYVDTTVAFGTSYSYQVVAVNGTGSSLPSNTVTVLVPAIPAAPASFTVSAVKANGNNYTATLVWTLAGAAPTSFTIQRATNLGFTTNVSTSTVAGNLLTVTQTVTKNTTYYYRIRANNSIGGWSAWTNALPFPIRTGP
jgi:FtsP/CotA-like multicopper oxidase with cupredoxin domain